MVTLKIKLDFVYTYVYKKANQYINKIGYCYRLLRLKSFDVASNFILSDRNMIFQCHSIHIKS